MIYVNLKGSIGNQLFQFAAALRLAKGNIDVIQFLSSNLPPRVYAIDQLMPAEFLPKLANEPAEALMKNSNAVYVLNDHNDGYCSDQALLDAHVDVTTNDILLDGYFQSGKNLSILRAYFLSTNNLYSLPLYDELRDGCSRQAIIHMCGRDYLRPDFQKELGLINLSYVDRAIALLIDEVDDFVIYTETAHPLESYKEKTFIKIGVEFDEIKIFKELLRAETLIVSNSSLSITAAAISLTIKKLIRPARWSRKYLSDSLTDKFHSRVVVLPNSFYPIN